MFSMYRQSTLDGSTALTNSIKVLPKNDGEIYRLWLEANGGDVGNVIEQTTGLVCWIISERGIRSRNHRYTVNRGFLLATISLDCSHVSRGPHVHHHRLGFSSIGFIVGMIDRSR
jgi:hypothetical protein